MWHKKCQRKKIYETFTISNFIFESLRTSFALLFELNLYIFTGEFTRMFPTHKYCRFPIIFKNKFSSEKTFEQMQKLY